MWSAFSIMMKTSLIHFILIDRVMVMWNCSTALLTSIVSIKWIPWQELSPIGIERTSFTEQHQETFHSDMIKASSGKMLRS
jgi:hypothetical protein